MAKSMTGSMTALLHGSRSQGRKTDDVSRGVDVRERGLKVFVHRQSTTVVRDDANGRQIKLSGRPHASDGVHKGLGRDRSGLFQSYMDLSVGVFSNGDDFFVVIERDADAFHLLLEDRDDFRIHELEEPRSFVDEGDGNAHGGEYRRIFGSN